LLNRRRHGAGELRGGVAQGIIAGGHRSVHVCFQIPQPAQQADHAPTDLLDHRRNVGIGGGLTREKAGWATLVSPIKIGPLQEEHVRVQIELEGTAKALDKRDRSCMHLAPRVTA